MWITDELIVIYFFYIFFQKVGKQGPRKRVNIQMCLVGYLGQDRQIFPLARVEKVCYRLGLGPVTCQHTGDPMYSQAITNAND